MTLCYQRLIAGFLAVFDRANPDICEALAERFYRFHPAIYTGNLGWSPTFWVTWLVYIRFVAWTNLPRYASFTLWRCQFAL